MTLCRTILILTAFALCSSAKRNNTRISLRRVASESIFENLETVDAHISIAAEILDKARETLHWDLEKLCANDTYPEKPVDCSDIFRHGFRKDGIYDVWPTSRVLKGPIKVYCDLTNDGGGWTVIQRRGDYRTATEYFYRDWFPYKTGFGDLKKDFWFGNDNIFALTSLRTYELRIDLTDWEENSTYANYNEFWISDESVNYTLHIAKYHGTAGDSLEVHNKRRFSTKDRDFSQTNCAVKYKGAWWYEECYSSNLNGPYLRGKQKVKGGVTWNDFKGDSYSLKRTTMKIRPNDFEIINTSQN